MNIALFPGILLHHYLAGLNEMERIIIGGPFALVGILLQQMFTGEVKFAPLQTTQVKGPSNTSTNGYRHLNVIKAHSHAINGSFV